MKKNLPFFLSILSIFLIQKTEAQSIGDYRSAASGDWSSVSTWQMFNGATWAAAITVPTQLSGVITVSDSVTVTGTDSADQVIVSPTGVINVLGTLKLFDGTGTDLQCNGRLIISLGGTLGNNDANVTIGYSSAKQFDIEGALQAAATFNGTAMQTINGSYGSGYIGPQITLNNSANLTLTGTIGVSGVNFISGKILSPGYFVIGQFTGSNFTGQGPSSFIDGNVACIVYDSTPAHFNLPIGKGNEYLPLQFFVKTSPTAGETGFTISIRDTALPTLAINPPLTKVSSVRYYNIANNPSVGIDTASLQLSYDGSDGVTDPTYLRIAQSDTIGGANKWVDLGGVGSAKTNGTIATAVNFKTSGNFVLANASGGSNTLPLHFVAFTATPNKQTVALNWQTASEVNTSYFNVERSVTANNWATVGTVNANKNSSANSYTFTDATVQNTGSYIYRIKEADKDGTAYFSNEVLVRFQDGSNKMNVSVLYPNPATDVLNYYVFAATNDAVTVVVTGLDGKVFAVQHSAANQSMQVGLKNLANGTYILTFTNAVTGEKVVKKIVKM